MPHDNVPIADSEFERADSIWPSFLTLSALTGLAFLLSLSKVPVKWGQLWRWPMHAGIMFLWSLAFAICLRRILKRAPHPGLEMGLVIPAAIAAELVQCWMPLHTPDGLGLTANLVGVALAGLLLAVHKRRQAQRG